uniref:GST C-terminal domain-containing protein n=1 Tax=Lepisosteus oculatus TaxID=7918 RepID=W5MFE5_LEPOC
MKLYVSEGNPHCLKVLAAVKVTGVICEIQHVNHEERVVPYLSRPVLPALQLDSGNYLFSANAICQYLFTLTGQEASDATNQWLEWEGTQLQPAVTLALHTVVLQGMRDKATGYLQKHLSHMDQSLTKSATSYLTSKTVTVADVVLWGALYPFLSDPTLVPGGLQAVTGWFQRVGGLQACQAAAQAVLKGQGGLAALKPYLQRQPSPRHPAEKSTTNEPEGEGSEHSMTEEEIQAAADIWCKGLSIYPKPREIQHPM